MRRRHHPVLERVLPELFENVRALRDAFGGRKPFTLDGRLVGDIGEVVAEEEFDITLHRKLKKGHDGVTTDGRLVNVKATFQDSVAIRTIPDYCIAYKLYRDGSYELVFNGPGSVIRDRYRHRQGIGKTQLSFPISELKTLSASVRSSHRIPRRRKSVSRASKQVRSG